MISLCHSSSSRYGVWTGGDTSGYLASIGTCVHQVGPQLLLRNNGLGCLLMELWGTYLANWTWANEVPWTGLTAWNPPLLVGAFYCLGDLLVNLSVERFEGKHRLEVNG